MLAHGRNLPTEPGKHEFHATPASFQPKPTRKAPGLLDSVKLARRVNGESLSWICQVGSGQILDRQE
jgi:hypothetical protein